MYREMGWREEKRRRRRIETEGSIEGDEVVQRKKSKKKEG